MFAQLGQQHENVKALNKVFQLYTEFVQGELNQYLDKLLDEIQEEHQVDRKHAVKILIESGNFEINCNKNCSDCKCLIENKCFFGIN